VHYLSGDANADDSIRANRSSIRRFEQMKSKFSRRSLIKGMATAAVAPAAAVLRTGQMKEPVDYVNPNMGGIGQLLSSTSPFVKLPYVWSLSDETLSLGSLTSSRALHLHEVIQCR
jgi:hypothetical protein